MDDNNTIYMWKGSGWKREAYKILLPRNNNVAYGHGINIQPKGNVTNN